MRPGIGEMRKPIPFLIISILLIAVCVNQPAAVPAATDTIPTATTQPEPTSTVMTTAAPISVPTSELKPEVGFTPTFESEPCPFELPPSLVEGEDVDCGFVAVPADHDDHGAGTLRLAIVVLRDQSENHQPDPVILLSGGPGEKTVANALHGMQMLAPFFPNRDFILNELRKPLARLVSKS